MQNANAHGKERCDDEQMERDNRNRINRASCYPDADDDIPRRDNRKMSKFAELYCSHCMKETQWKIKYVKGKDKSRCLRCEKRK